MRSSVLVDGRPEEVKRSHRDESEPRREVKNLHDIPFRMEKSRVGDAVRAAIGDRPLKEFGHEGLMSAIVSGDKVPEYLARIYQDPAARRRLAFALLRDDETVTVRTVIEFNQKVG